MWHRRRKKANGAWITACVVSMSIHVAVLSLLLHVKPAAPAPSPKPPAEECPVILVTIDAPYDREPVVHELVPKPEYDAEANTLEQLPPMPAQDVPGISPAMEKALTDETPDAPTLEPPRPIIRMVRIIRPLPERQASDEPPEEQPPSAESRAGAGTHLQEGAQRQAGSPPPYPALARQRGLQGLVLLRVLVAPDGSVKDVQVEESPGHKLLEEAAIRAVKAWRFKPATIDGVPVESHLRVPIRFQLLD